MSRRLLTDEQVERVAAKGAESVAELIWLERSDLDLGVDFERVEQHVIQATEDNLRDFLEGLHEPEGVA